MQRAADHSRQRSSTNNVRDLSTRVYKIEAMIMKNNQLLEKLLQQQFKQQQDTIPGKPAFLPFSSVEAIAAFKNYDADKYRETVAYLEYLAGFSLKEAIWTCFQATFGDSVINSMSWVHHRDAKVALAETRAAHAIHDAVLRNVHFARPSRMDVGDNLKTALTRSVPD